MRPLGIASYENKIVQLAVKKILAAIYEPRFLNCMYGLDRTMLVSGYEYTAFDQKN